MKNRKIAWILAVILVLGSLTFTGCGTKSNQGNAESGEVKPINLKMATSMPPDHPSHSRVLKFVEKIEKETNGAVKITVYPADQLGDYTVVFEELMKGTIDMSNTAMSSSIDSRVEMLFLHYFAKDFKEMKEFYARGNYMFDTLAEICDERNIKLLGIDFLGFGGLGFNKKPTNPFEPGKDKGVVIRTSTLDASRQWAEAMGYRTVTVPYSELFSALQTGIVEGWTGGDPVLNYVGFRDAIKYYIQYNCFVDTADIMMNKDTWNKLTPEQQNIIQDAADELQANSVIENESDGEEYLEKMKEAGIEVTTLTDEKLEELAKFTRKNVWPLSEERIGKENMDALRKAYGFE